MSCREILVSLGQLDQAVGALRAAQEPHWAVLALAGASACAYDWVPDGDHLAWLGDPRALFDLSEEAPTSVAVLKTLMRPGTEGLLDFAVCDSNTGPETFTLHYAVRNRNGDYVEIEDRGMVIRNASGMMERVVGIVYVADRSSGADGEKVGHLDRAQMRDAIDAAIDWAQAEQSEATLLMASIDGLGTINDSYGLDIADEVIAETSRRLSAALGPDGTFGRVGGNKLAILLLDCRADQISDLSARLRDVVQASMIPSTGGPIAATISLGAVTLPTGAQSSEVAMMRAEDALAMAKRSGRSSLNIYDASPEREAARRKKAQIGAEIIAALRTDRFRLAYQPIVCARTGRIESYEALVRMLREDGTQMPAGDFIPVSEDLGLVRDLDRRVLELASASLRRAPALKLAVNLSGMSVGDPAWLKTFNSQIVGDRSIAQRLTVEVTETAALHDIDEGIRFVKQIRAGGCRVAIDDFGVGYTSFRNLQLLDLSCVKIDGSFVKGITRRPDNQAFVRTLVSLAKTFNLEVVAEWVGSQDEATLLRALGVDKFQGAFYGMPEMTPPWDRRTAVAR